MSDFLVGKFKSLEAAQSLKVGSKTITNLIDSAAVSSQITLQVGSGGVDSVGVSGLIDSAFLAKNTNNLSEGENLYYTKTRSDSDFNFNFNLNNSLLTTDRLNEGETNLFYTDDRVRVVSLDSEETIQLIDSAYIQARTSGGLDSSSTIALIDSSHVQARQSSSGVTIYSTFQQLVNATGMAQGDQALVTATNNIYIYAGTGWFKIATVQNNSPTPITGVDSNYILADNGTATIVTAASTDPEGFPITFGFSTSGLGSIATVSQDSSVFTITPSTNTSNGGTFTLTITATDNVNGALNFPASFTLAFATDWTSHTLSQSLQYSGTKVATSLFGEVISIDGDYAVITARNLLYSGSKRGKAFAFYKNAGTWAQQADLTHSDASTSNYGADAGISGNTIAVADNDGNGAVRIFTRSGTTWSLQQKITGNSTTMNGFADGAIALSGNKVAVGCYAYATPGSSTGRIVVFNRSGSTWSFESFLDASDAAQSDLMGYYNVGISGNYVVAGSPNKEAVYIWFYNGSSWSQQAKITASDGNSSHNFGTSVAIDGDIVVVGAPNKNSEMGAAYVFTRSGTSWSQTTILGNGGSIPNDLSTGDQFGYTVDIDENSLIVGAPNVASPRGSGSAYIFTTNNSGSSWTQKKKFTTTSGDITDNYAYGRRTVAIDQTSESIIVGAYEDDTGASAVGKAYFYED